MAQLIAVRVPRVADQIAALDLIWGQGDAALPLPATAGDAELARVIRALRPDGLVVPRPDGVLRTRRLPDGAEVEPGTALVVTTSGSTGAPKGVVLDHGALAASTAASLARLGCPPGERWLLCLPLEHVAGVQVLLRSRALGADPIVIDGFDPTAVGAAIASGEAGHVSLVPTQLVRLLDAGIDLSGLHGVLLGGAAPGADLLARARAAGVAVTVSYGMTETGGGCVYDGRPLEGVTVDTSADGRLRLAGPILMAGYRDEQGATDRAAVADGAFTSADLGVVRPDGAVEVHGRADEVAISGGENVALVPIREAVAALPEVRESVVVARPDEEWGELVVAVVALVPGRSLGLQELRDRLRDRLPPAALPRDLRVVPALPRTGLGKPDGAAIRALVAGPGPAGPVSDT